MSDFFEIDFLDVETSKSGDAICMRYELAGQTYIHVVDGGYQTTGEALVEHIRTYYGNPQRIDHVVVTHNDGDHARGLLTVLSAFDVGALWMLRPWAYANELIDRFKRYSNVESLKDQLKDAYSNLHELEEAAERLGIPIYAPFQGTKIGAFTVLSPSKEMFLDLVLESEKTPDAVSEDWSIAAAVQKALSDGIAQVATLVRAAWGEETFSPNETSAENEMSVVQYATLNGEKILLTGDTGRRGLRQLIEYAPFAGLALPGINRFQVPHHGSRRNVSTELLDQILGPRLAQGGTGASSLAIISSAKADTHHPRKSVVRALHHRGAVVISTEGKNIYTYMDAPYREWSAVIPMPYPEDQED